MYRFFAIQRYHTEHVVLGQVHIPLCVVGIADVVYRITTVVRAAHPQLRKRLRKTLTPVGLVKHVLLVWIQLQSDTVLLVQWYLTGVADVVSSDSCIHLCWGIHFLPYGKVTRFLSQVP